MRRPPDKDAQITDRDVHSSNATLNAFLGSRAKSWMTNVGDSPVRPTPRAVGAVASSNITISNSNSTDFSNSTSQSSVPQSPHHHYCNR
jgi:hypothetical protein